MVMNGSTGHSGAKEHAPWRTISALAYNWRTICPW